jgi:MFS family permease
MRKLLLGLITFLSSFLLFLTQPLVANFILPRFGGGMATWGICLFFFQTILCISYFSAHFFNRHYPRQRQKHLLTMALIVGISIPIEIGNFFYFTSPALSVLTYLLLSIGMSYYTLGMISPLLQTWYRDLIHKENSFRLYALSNTGSLLGLLIFPFYLEIYYPLSTQFTLWKLALSVLALLIIIYALVYNEQDVLVKSNSQSIFKAPLSSFAIWIILSALNSNLLVTFTSIQSESIGPIPFIWITPLATFLLSYIVVFSFSHPINFNFLWVITALLVLCYGYLTDPAGNNVAEIGKFIILNSFLFFAFTLANNSLFQRRPQAELLTNFYFAMSLGGAIGGITANFITPYIFSLQLEGKIILLLLLTTTLLIEIFINTLLHIHKIHLVALLLLAFSNMINTARRNANLVYQARDFYGTIKVFQEQSKTNGAFRVLVHGNTVHGIQYMGNEEKNLIDSTYYSTSTGIAHAIRTLDRPLSICAIGLGAGIVTTHLTDKDEILFIEVSQAMATTAQEQFSFLENAKGKVRLVIDDGRRYLTNNQQESFDIIFIDAFSSDTLPTHLFTHEAFQLYTSLLKKESIIVVHISNRYLDLKPELFDIANKLNLTPLWFSHKPKDANGIKNDFQVQTDYVLMTNSELVSNKLNRFTRPFSNTNKVAEWSDEKHSILPILLRKYISK